MTDPHRNQACVMRGHKIVFDADVDAWRFADTGELTTETWEERGCGHCGKPNTPEGHDAYLGTLDGVMNACCGHGSTSEAYVQFEDGSELREEDAVRYFKDESHPEEI